MPTALTVTASASSGAVKPALTAADATNNTFVNDGRTWVEINNGAASNINATFVTTLTYSGFAIADQVVLVQNGTSKIVGPFDTNLYNDANTGAVTITWSAIATITVGAFKLGTT
jgi:hypothetical protein